MRGVRNTNIMVWKVFIKWGCLLQILKVIYILGIKVFDVYIKDVCFFLVLK